MRPRKPEAIKRAQGTHRPDRSNPTQPPTTGEVPAPPSYVKGPALKEWNRVVPALQRLGVVGELDWAACIEYCQTFAEVGRLERAISREGHAIKTQGGTRKQNPKVGALDKARSQLHRWTVALGLTPSARSRVSASPEPERNPVDEVAARRAQKREQARR